MSTFAFFAPALILAESRSPVTSLECPETQITPFRKELHTIPESDAKSAQISNAVATVELIDAYRKHVLKQSDERPSSPVVLALNSSTTPGLEESFHAARIHGVCLENNENANKIDSIIHKKPLQFLEEVLNLGGSIDFPSSINPSNPGSCRSKDSLIPSPAPIFRALAYPESPLNIHAAMKTIASACSGENHLSLHQLPKPTVHAIDSTAELYSLIQDRFGSNTLKQPIALTTCRQLLEKGRNYSGLGIEKGARENCSENDARAIILIGSRRNHESKRCEVEVKSPGSTDCGRYSKDFNCHEGNLWVDLEALGRNSIQGVYLSPVGS